MTVHGSGIVSSELFHQNKFRFMNTYHDAKTGNNMDNNDQQTNSNFYQQDLANQQGSPYMGSGYGGPGSSHGCDSSVERKAPNIFQQFALSFVPTQYGRLANVKTGSMIGFVTLLTLIATIIVFISPALSFSSDNVNAMMDLIPDFEVKNGRFSIDDEFTYANDGMFVFLTDGVHRFTYEQVSAIADRGYNFIIMAGSERISVMQNGEYQQYDFKSFNRDIPLSKSWIVNTVVPVLKVIFIITYILFYVGRTLWYFLCAAVYFLFAMLIASILHKKQPSGALFGAAVYSKVPMFCVAVLLDVVSFVNISIPFIFRIVITMAFMGFAIAKLPENN